MAEVYSFVNSHIQNYSYLKSNLQLGKNSTTKFDILNSHILNTIVLPGEIVIIGDTSTPACTSEEAFYMKMAFETHSALMAGGSQGDGFLVENHELLIKMLGYSSLGIGSVGGAWSKHLEGIKKTLEEIEVAHADHLRSNTTKSRDAFYAMRKVLFAKLDDQLKSFASYGSGLRNQGSIKDMLGISTKSFLHTGVISGYAKTIGAVANASNLIKKGTYIGIGLDVAAAGASINNACSSGREDQCKKAKYVETSKLSGSVLAGSAGGTIGAAAATSLCIVALGIASGGPGAFACAFIGGAMGGAAGGYVGSEGGELFGDAIYETFGQ
ncbi:hypothetical protein [Pseudomonas sp. NPDC086251]|jgi:hypothetical protein|uniref:hypothetical protein n=1 Tax=Pseudomonas sp. NPDC086251 TaxID=3364431 RepID=UPI0038378860